MHGYNRNNAAAQGTLCNWWLSACYMVGGGNRWVTGKGTRSNLVYLRIYKCNIVSQIYTKMPVEF